MDNKQQTKQELLMVAKALFSCENPFTAEWLTEHTIRKERLGFLLLVSAIAIKNFSNLAEEEKAKIIRENLSSTIANTEVRLALGSLAEILRRKDNTKGEQDESSEVLHDS